MSTSNALPPQVEQSINALVDAAIQINTMFLLETEVPTAMAAFAVKFADIAARHRSKNVRSVFNCVPAIWQK